MTADFDQVAEKRDLRARSRDQHASLRDDRACADDGSALRRDADGDLRDTLGDQRDWQADQRSVSLERAEELENAGDIPHSALGRVLSEAVAEQGHAAEDRRKAALDRTRSGSDRASASADRSTANAGRARSHEERADSKTDRQQSAVDRQQSAVDRQHSAGTATRAHTDQLTGTYLRAAGLVELGREVSRARRTGQPLAVVRLRVGGVKSANADGDQPSGDWTLVQVVTCLRAHLRPHDVIVRLTGDELVCVLPAYHVHTAAMRFDIISAELQQAHAGLSITVGIAELDGRLDEADAPEQLIKRAGLALRPHVRV